MGKGGSSATATDPAIQQGMLANSTALVDIAKQQSDNSKELFNLTEPGLKTAEDFYSTLASGDPAAILKATAPVAQQTAQSAAGAKSSILANSPQGGERNLALEEVDVNRGAINSKAAAGSVLGAPNALAALSGQGVGESIAAAGTGISGISSSNQGLLGLGNLNLGQEQIKAEEKGNFLAAMGEGAKAGATLGANA